jgi:hypothetical protein
VTARWGALLLTAGAARAREEWYRGLDLEPSAHADPILWRCA